MGIVTAGTLSLLNRITVMGLLKRAGAGIVTVPAEADLLFHKVHLKLRSVRPVACPAPGLEWLVSICPVKSCRVVTGKTLLITFYLDEVPVL
jgi:hypothetical protein